jgi:hypothetical protein
MEKHIAFFMKLPFREKLAVIAFLLLLTICGGLLSSCFTVAVQRTIRPDGSTHQTVTIEPKPQPKTDSK